jgi:hypothetical protein
MAETSDPAPQQICCNRGAPQHHGTASANSSCQSSSHQQLAASAAADDDALSPLHHHRPRNQELDLQQYVALGDECYSEDADLAYLDDILSSWSFTDFDVPEHSMLTPPSYCDADDFLSNAASSSAGCFARIDAIRIADERSAVYASDVESWPDYGSQTVPKLDPACCLITDYYVYDPHELMIDAIDQESLSNKEVPGISAESASTEQGWNLAAPEVLNHSSPDLHGGGGGGDE